LWQVAIKALGFGDVNEIALNRFARSSTASFLVESAASDDANPEFRLFHQALNDALLHARAEFAGEREDEQALTRAFIAKAQQTGWAGVPKYLLRSLPTHAARADLADELLTDDAYLLYADLFRVLPLANQATTKLGQQRKRLLRLASRSMLTADAPNRLAIFSVTEAVEGLEQAYMRADVRTPYRALWASIARSSEDSLLLGHWDWVNAVCAFTVQGHTFLATGSDDYTVRIWDPTTSTQQHTLEGHTSRVHAICAFTLHGRAFLATVSDDHTVRIWDPATGTQQHEFHGHDGAVLAICAYTHNGQTLLATGGDDHTVRIWDPATGTQQRVLEGHTDTVNAICAFTINDRTLLATGGEDETLRIWDPATGTQQHEFHGHDSWMSGVCAYNHHGRTLLATSSHDDTVRIWDPTTGTQQHVLEGHSSNVNGVCVATLNGDTVLASVSDDRTIRIWDVEKPITALVIPTRDEARSVACANGVLFTGTTTGVLAVRLDPECLSQSPR
jgi:hypothetical protein